MTPTNGPGAGASTAPTPPSEAREFLTFCLAAELFALEVVRVQEILDIAPVTRVPNAPDIAPGILNVRGHVVPLVDLRTAFGLPPANEVASRTVVFDVRVDGDPTRVAMVVDAVRDVVHLADIDIDELSVFGTRWNRDHVAGLARVGDDLLVLLDIDRIFEAA